MSENLTALFLRFRDQNDMRALARVFDQTAPELASVAAHLARSAPDAEDLVQATFLAAIESAAGFDPRRPLVPWLLGILSMQARKQRERASREVDPQRVHRPDDSGPESEVQAREITSAVDAAVSQLDGRYAGLVRRHLLDGAPPAELAREFELSSITTRVRLHRGMKQLRKLLPASMAGTAFGASLWRIDIAAIRGRVLRRAAELTGAAVPVASLASAGLMIALLVPIAVATPAWLLWRSHTNAESTAAVELTAAASPTQPAPTSSSANAASQIEALAEAEAEPEPEPRSLSAQSNVPSDQAIVRGRLLRADGSPASEASLKVDGYARNGPEVEWTKPPVSTNSADGSFELAFVAPAGYRISMQVDAPNCARAMWQWDDLAAGTIRDLGQVQLEASGSVLARVVNAQGELLFQGWSLNARIEPPDHLLGRTAVTSYAVVDAQTSTFKLEGLPPRRAALSATHQSDAKTEKLSFEVLAGQLSPVDLVYRGPDLQRRITVKITYLPKAPFLLQPEQVWIEPLGGAPIAAVLRPQSIGTYTVDGLAPGPYRVRIVDPRLVEWTKEAVQAGAVVNAPVKGNAAMQLTILNEDQTPYSGRYELIVRHFGNSSPAGNQPLVAADEDPPANGLVSQVWAGTYSLELKLPDGGSKQFKVADLQAMETRNVLVTLGASSTIHGRVLANDGTTPLANVEVQLTPGALAGHTLGKGASVMTTDGDVPPVHSSAKTDAGGNFQFAGLQPGNWTLRASWSRWLLSDRTIVVPDTLAVDIVQPACGFFAGRLLVPEHAPLADTMLVVYVPGGNGFFPELRIAPTPGELNADGSFRLGPFPIGQVDASLQVFSEIYGEHGPGRKVASGPQLGIFTIAAGEPSPVEIDLRAIFPARVNGCVRVDGTPVVAGRVRRLPLEENGALRGAESGVTFEGRFALAGFAPGHEVFLEYVSPEGWAWTSPQGVTPAPGAETTVDLAIQTIEREVQIVDATTHLPVANQRIAWRTGQGNAISDEDIFAFAVSTAQSDAAGKLRVKMPAGTTRPVALPGGALTQTNVPSGTFSPATIDWSAGATTIVLQLNR